MHFASPYAAEVNAAFRSAIAHQNQETERGREIQKMSSEQMLQVIHSAGTNKSMNVGDPFGDGDQSTLSAKNATVLWDVWTSGGDFFQLVSSNRISQFGMACLKGDLQRVKQMLGQVQSEERNRLLERRESITRVTPLMFCVLGAKMLFENQGPFRWVEVSKELLQHGAKVDARDIAGHTAGFHASSEDSNHLTLEILKHIVAANGNVNLTNRQGRTALMSAILGCNLPAIKALLAYGADLHVKDIHGDCPMDAAALYPAALEVVSMHSRSAAARSAWREDHRACAACGSAREGLLRCKRCSSAFYCGSECQRRHWPEHKLQCRPAGQDPATSDEIPVVLSAVDPPERPDLAIPAVMGRIPFNIQTTGPLRAPAGVGGGQFVVKVQARTDGVGSMLVYDKTRTVCICILQSHPRAADVLRAVRAVGVSGLKAFFRARVADGCLHLTLARPCSPKDW